MADLRRRATDLQGELERTRSSEQSASQRVDVQEAHRAKRVHLDRQGVTRSWRAMLVVTSVLAVAFLLV